MRWASPSSDDRSGQRDHIPCTTQGMIDGATKVNKNLWLAGDAVIRMGAALEAQKQFAESEYMYNFCVHGGRNDYSETCLYV